MTDKTKPSVTRPQMTSTRAAAILRLLRVSRTVLIADLNRLAGTNFDRRTAYKWLTEGAREPPLTLTLYLRLKIEQAWRERGIKRANLAPRIASLQERTEKFLAIADAASIERFERRLTIFEDENRPV